MLCLTRHKNDAVRIDLRRQGLGFVDVVVIEIRGDKVRLGFDALPNVPVNRMEIWEAIERNANEDTELYEESDDGIRD